MSRSAVAFSIDTTISLEVLDCADKILYEEKRQEGLVQESGKELQAGARVEAGSPIPREQVLQLQGFGDRGELVSALSMSCLRLAEHGRFVSRTERKARVAAVNNWLDVMPEHGKMIAGDRGIRDLQELRFIWEISANMNSYDYEIPSTWRNGRRIDLHSYAPDDVNVVFLMVSGSDVYAGE